MKKAEITNFKRFAKEGLKTAGIAVNMCDMILLETGSGDGKLYFVGNDAMYIDYVMIEDSKTGRQYQISYGVNNYTAENESLYNVTEYGRDPEGTPEAANDAQEGVDSFTSQKALKQDPRFIAVSEGNKKLVSSNECGFLIFNLPAVITCPYRTAACEKSCYALKAERIYPSARDARKNNFDLSMQPDFVDRMIFTIAGYAATKYAKNDKIVVRIHESGDFYNAQYAEKWLAIARAISRIDNRVVFMAYTKSVKYFAGAVIPDNMVVRFSLWDDTKPDQKAIADALNLPTYSAADAQTVDAMTAAGLATRCDCRDCGHCGKCWDRSEKSIYCVIH